MRGTGHGILKSERCERHGQSQCSQCSPAHYQEIKMEKPMFQRRHYEALAELIRSLREKAEHENSDVPLTTIVNRVAAMLETDNPRFDRARFEKAVAATKAEAEREVGRVGAGKGWK